METKQQAVVGLLEAFETDHLLLTGVGSLLLAKQTGTKLYIPSHLLFDLLPSAGIRKIGRVPGFL